MEKTTVCDGEQTLPKISSRKIEILKVIAHPIRIMILEELLKGVKCVSDLEDFLSIRQPNVSQHLSLLRRMQVIDFYMDGHQRCYFLKDPVIPELLSALRMEFAEDLPAPACCPAKEKREECPSKSRSAKTSHNNTQAGGHHV